MSDRIIEAVTNEGFYAEMSAHDIPLTAALVARAGVGVCPECHKAERPKHLPLTPAGTSCRHEFHDIHEAYEQAKKEAGLE